jgi:hypothetical protein
VKRASARERGIAEVGQRHGLGSRRMSTGRGFVRGWAFGRVEIGNGTTNVRDG